MKLVVNLDSPVVLGIPRGGIAVAFEVARTLDAPLGIFLCTKLGVPGQEELAFGAIAADYGRFLDEQIIQASDISRDAIERISRKAQQKLQERAALYGGRRPPLSVQGRIVILVDDGIATGASMYASIHALRQMGPEKLMVAVPVAPSSACDRLRPLVDELVCLYDPKYFDAVGQFYKNFSQVSDDKVIGLLWRADQLGKRANS